MKLFPSIVVTVLCTLSPVLGTPAAVPKDVAEILAADAITDFWVKTVNNNTFIQKVPLNSLKCGDTVYTPEEQKNAFFDGSGHTAAHTKVKAKRQGKNGGKTYPSIFKNQDNPPIDFHHCGVVHNVFEYPILRDKKPFKKGDNQGPDRVVYKHEKKKSDVFTYCGAIFHPRQQDHSVELCREVGGS